MKTSGKIQAGFCDLSISQSRCQTQVRNFQHPPKPQIRTLRTWMFFAPSKSRKSAKIWNMSLQKSSDHIQIKIKMPNPSQDPPASFKAPNQDFKDMGVLCSFKIKVEPKFRTRDYQRPLTMLKSR